MQLSEGSGVEYVINLFGSHGGICTSSVVFRYIRHEISSTRPAGNPPFPLTSPTFDRSRIVLYLDLGLCIVSPSQPFMVLVFGLFS